MPYGLIFHLLLQHTVRARSCLVPGVAEFLSELLIESDIDDRVDHGVRVAQHVDPEHVPFQLLWQLRGKHVKEKEEN